MGKLDGKVAFITGAARGQGRAHALRLASEGCDIIGVDICAGIPTVRYSLGTREQLDETVSIVQAAGRRAVGKVGDTRDVEQVRQAFEEGVAEVGPVSIVVANAGIVTGIPGSPPNDQDWYDVIDVNLTGVWNTGRVAIPHMVEQDNGGSIILTSSTGGLLGLPTDSEGLLGYTAAKHGVIGLMRSWANLLAKHNIRVNSVAPTAVNTPMVTESDFAVLGDISPAMAAAAMNAMPVDLIEPADVAAAVLWLASDESRYVTGSVIAVDAGQLNKR